MEVRDLREGVPQVFSAKKVEQSMNVCLIARTPQASDALSDGALRYDVKPLTRSAQLLANSYTCESTGASHAGVAAALLAELHRRAAFRALFSEDLASIMERQCRLSTGGVGAKAGVDDACQPSGASLGVSKTLLSRQELQELPARWVLESINSADKALSERTNVTPLDIGATVALTCSNREEGGKHKESAVLYRVVATAPMARGEYWVDITASSSSSNGGGGGNNADENCSGSSAIQRVEVEKLRLTPPLPVFPDAFIPCDEAHSPRGTSTSLYLTFLLAQQQQQQCRRGPLYRHGRNWMGESNTEAEQVARGIAADMAKATFLKRRTLHLELTELLQKASTTSLQGADGLFAKVEAHTQGRDCIILSCRYRAALNNAEGYTSDSGAATLCVVRIELLVRTLRKLALMWDSTKMRHNGGNNSTRGNNNNDMSTGSGSGTDDASAAINGIAPTAMQAVEEVLLATPESSLVDSPSSSSRRSHEFFTRVATMMLRYGTLQGEDGYNQGPHAAVPPRVLSCLSTLFSITTEAFASPLNAQLGCFGSLFPDTDCYFGSVGSFLDVEVRSGHVEANPPFNASVIERMSAHMTSCLERSECVEEDTATGMQQQQQRVQKSLLFVIVLPSHDAIAEDKATSSTGTQTASRPPRKGRRFEGGSASPSVAAQRRVPTKLSTERRLRDSRFCLAHILCAAAESAYVDGHQHRLRAPLFCIETPTRLIVLGNSVARQMYPDAADRLETVRKTWSELTQSVV